jgi:hypothetical protein
LVDKVSHLLREIPKVDSVAAAGGTHNQLLLPLVSDEAVAQFFGMSVDAISHNLSERKTKKEHMAY